MLRRLLLLGLCLVTSLAGAAPLLVLTGGKGTSAGGGGSSSAANGSLCWTQPSNVNKNLIWASTTSGVYSTTPTEIDPPAGAGQQACYATSSISGLTVGATYYYVVGSKDTAGNQALLSNEVSGICCNDDGWTTASTGVGVILATAFDTQAEVTDYRVINGEESHISWDQTTRLGTSGGSLRFDVLDADAAASGLWGRYLNATTHHVFGNGETYYVRYSYRLDEAMWRYWPQDDLAFDAGTAQFMAGETVTGGTSGAHATIARVFLVSGAWSGTATGGLVLTGVVGTFVDNEALTSASGAATATRWGFPTNVVSNGGGFKLSIFSWHNSSAANNEVVTQNTLDRAYFQMYNQDGTVFPPLRDSVSTPCNSSNFQLQGAIDLGTPSSPANCAQYANRYGPLYDYGSGSGNPTANDIVTQGHPRSEAAASGVKIVDGVWFTLLTQVTIGTLGTASSTVKQWIQRPGASSYTLVHDYSGVKLGTDNGGHDTVFLLPYETGKQPGAKGHNAVVWYDQLIVSTSTIPARIQ